MIPLLKDRDPMGGVSDHFCDWEKINGSYKFVHDYVWRKGWSVAIQGRSKALTLLHMCVLGC